MTIKNIWSLNVDEAIVAEKIKKELGKKLSEASKTSEFEKNKIRKCLPLQF